MRLSEIIPNLDPTAIYSFEVRIEGSSGRAITASMDTASLVIADQNGNQTPATVKAAAVKIITFNMTGAALQAMAVNGKAILSIAVGNAVGFASNSIRIENIKINQYVANSSQQLAIRIGAGYKYGFNGQEKDDEIKGSGNSMNYKYRMHDPRLGRFLSLDPLAPDYPHNSPYAFSENRVIDGIELEGLEWITIEVIHQGKNKPVIENVLDVDFSKPYKLTVKTKTPFETLVETERRYANKESSMDEFGLVEGVKISTGERTFELKSKLDENNMSDDFFPDPYGILLDEVGIEVDKETGKVTTDEQELYDNIEKTNPGATKGKHEGLKKIDFDIPDTDIENTPKEPINKKKDD